MYGSDTVAHMLSGKAVARAIRGNFLLEGALMIILLKSVFPENVEDGVEEQADSVDESSKKYLFTVDFVADLEHILDELQRNKLDVSDCSILDGDGLTFFVRLCLTALQET